MTGISCLECGNGNLRNARRPRAAISEADAAHNASGPIERRLSLLQHRQ
jgi:hypothetical protein